MNGDVAFVNVNVVSMLSDAVTPGQTVNAAKYWKKEGERGIVAAGAEADLLLLAANPLADISNTRTIEGLAAPIHE